MLSITSNPGFPVGEPQIILNNNGIATANTSGEGNILYDFILSYIPHNNCKNKILYFKAWESPMLDICILMHHDYDHFFEK